MMDPLTAAIAHVIDNDQHELEWACGQVRIVGTAFDLLHDAALDRDLYIRIEIATSLREHVCGDPGEIDSRDGVKMQFCGIAISHMYTHADSQALAQHFMDEREEER